MGFVLSPQGRGKAFTTTITSMGTLTQAMALANVLDDAEDMPAGEPPWPPPGLTLARAGELSDHFDGEEPLETPVTPEEQAIWDKHAAAHAQWLASPSADRGRVPAFKFGSMDGWLVTPAECRSIADGLERLLMDDDDWELLLDLLSVADDDETEREVRVFVQEFQSFNDRCAKEKGYTVS